MSECFDGRNGKSVKTSGDLRDLRRSVENGIVAVLPGKFFEESPESYLSLSRGAVWGYFGYRFDITEPLGFVQDT